MEINYTCKEQHLTTFADLKEGDLFAYLDEFYIKIPYMIDAEDEDIASNTVRLPDGACDSVFCANELVIKYNLPIEIKEEGFYAYED